jgi:Tol biopolymer transport system component
VIRKLCLTTVAALLLCAPAAHATFKGGNGRVAYDVASKGIGDDGSATAYRAVATVQPDGRADRFLRECQQSAGKTVDGDCAIQYRTPVWRPDGRQLAFDAGRQLALISSTGSGFALLPAVSADDSQPAFSPSGRQLAFTGNGGIYVYDLSTRRARRIISRGADPDWSSSNRIAYERGGSIYTASAAGRSAKRVASGRDPGWSASGKSLIMARRGGIYTVGAGGKGLQRLLRCSRCAAPVFSPNGKLFAYDAPGVTVAQVATGRKVATLVQDFSGGGESFDGSNPSWARR